MTTQLAVDPSAAPDAKAPGRLDRVVAFARERGPGFVVEALVNFIGPLVIFDYAKPHLGEVNALIASSGPPILWSLVEFARHRKVDALSILVLTGIALSLLAFLGGGSAKLLQLREKLVTVTIGLVFVVSAIIRKPLIYELARAGMKRNSPEKLAEFEAMKDNAGFRRVMTTMTLVWGIGLLAEAGVAATLVMTLSVRSYLIVAPIIGNGTMATLGLWTWWYGARARRRGDARRAAERAAAQAGTVDAGDIART